MTFKNLHRKALINSAAALALLAGAPAMAAWEALPDVAPAHMYRLPTLRNITDTAPYFHNGSVNDRSEAVRVMGKTQLNKDLSEKDVQAIVAFLGALTGMYPEITMPRLPATSGFSL